MEKIVDARGLACPQPVVKAREALKNTDEGVIKVLVDNQAAVENVMKFGKHEGLFVSSEKKGEKSYEVVFQVGDREDLPQETEECCLPMTAEGKRGQVVVISSEQMGSGSEELGQILMKGFVYALTQLEDLPETVLLYNGGARLTVEGSKALEDFKTLESLGVEILTCGTCLNYYGLTEKLAVGAVTNMYEIAEKLAKAGSVIRP